jgi:hypothetical protein
MIRPPAAIDQAIAERREAGTPGRNGHDAGGLRCPVCGLDEVPWPRTAYCSERCRRRAAYLARTARRRSPEHPEDTGAKTKRTGR